MTTFVDTSALYALLDRSDPDHERVARVFPDLLGGDPLVTHSYVLVEATALVQRRLGIAAVRDLTGALLSAVETKWVDRELHDAALGALLAAGRRGVSLVDWTSFEMMRRLGIERAFALDVDFERQGFAVLP
ncbi:MAG: type II toxin-antitoxin system VapC family toxin [Thermoleophilaceae bacterium]